MRIGKLLILSVVIALLMAALPGCMPGEEEANAQGAAINDLRAKADSNAGQISGLTGRVGALEARATGEVSAASFAALQAQVNGLQTTIGAQELRIAELEAVDNDTSGTDTNGDELATVTRWRPRFSFDCIDVGALDNGTIEYTYEYDPRTIKEADVYTFKITFTNPAGGMSTADVKLDDLVLNILLTPNDNVMVSDDTDAYQVEGPYNSYWNTDIKTSASTGACRYIEVETDPFDLTVKEGKTVILEVEFELIYS
jgi:hypothetical protein